MPDGPARFVDPARGDDTSDGSRTQPWKTLSIAVSKLTPGDTLYLRGGTYYDHVRVSVRGTRPKPITIRSLPGELAIIDGGLREFFESPQTSWEPVPDGAPGEFRSVRTFPELGGSPGSTNVLGNFGDSMIPLHGYRFLTDLRSDNEYLDNLEGEKTAQGSGVYCGPGVYYDTETGRIHVRLAHTDQSALGIRVGGFLGKAFQPMDFLKLFLFFHRFHVLPVTPSACAAAIECLDAIQIAVNDQRIIRLDRVVTAGRPVELPIDWPDAQDQNPLVGQTQFGQRLVDQPVTRFHQHFGNGIPTGQLQ